MWKCTDVIVSLQIRVHAAVCGWTRVTVCARGCEPECAPGSAQLGPALARSLPPPWKEAAGKGPDGLL